MQEYYELKTPKGIMRGFIHRPMLNQYPICLIFHGFTGQCTGTKFSYVTIARQLEKKGIATLRLDFLGTGESDLSFIDMTFKEELACASRMLEEVLKMKEVTEVYVMGHSMGGAIASELAKQFPLCIKKLCLWAPALNLPDAIQYLTGQVKQANSYDHNGFEISDAFVEDICSRDLYKGLDIYKNKLMIIHGSQDTTVPYNISDKYLKYYHKPKFYCIENASHNFDKLEHIQEVIKLTCQFLGD